MPDPVQLSESVLAVVRRWNPAAMSTLAAMPAEFDSTNLGECSPRSVSVVGPPRSGRDAVECAVRASPDFALAGSSSRALLTVLAVDASSVIGREELTLLDDASARGTPVVVALTGIDTHADWQQVLVRDRKILADHHGAVPVTTVPLVSGGEQALLDAMIGASQARVASSGALLVDEFSAVIARTRRMIEAEMAVLSDRSSEDELRSERSRLLADRDGRRGELLVRIRSRLHRAGGELGRQISDAVRTIVLSARSRIEIASPSELEGIAVWLQKEIDSSTRNLDGSIEIVPGVVAARGFSSAPQIPADRPERRRGTEERITVVVGASAGVGLGRMVVAPLEMVPMLDVASVPVTLVLGGVAAWWLTRTRSVMADRARTRGWVEETMSAVRAQWEQRVQEALVDAEEELGAQIMAASRKQAASVHERIVAIDGELRDTARSRSGRLAACERDLAVLKSVGR
ncbi:hypothetical protein ABH922_003851 [Rhodococcus sp. 27YEA15]|uniref:hypothetical protein n=1 Tax=Rhodococcus sp. 27YEA15 TaxID=3156259 RepID=UPI003C7B2283